MQHLHVHVHCRIVRSLDLLQELNISGNRMRTLPVNLVNMPELRLLRAHSNLLKVLPDLTESSSLKVQPSFSTSCYFCVALVPFSGVWVGFLLSLGLRLIRSLA